MTDHRPYSPPLVQKGYRKDWQFAIDISRAPVLRPATLLIAAAPIMFDLSSAVGLEVQGLTLTWLASVAFIIAWVVLRVRCPQFLQEYRDYGAYDSRGHSHRFIIWEFYHNLVSLTAWSDVLKETRPKLLVETEEQVPDKVRLEFAETPSPRSSKGVRAHTPIFDGRDLYLPIVDDEGTCFLALREEDPRLRSKEKELFWILFTASAKENPGSRMAFWCLTGLAAALVALNTICNVLKAF